MSSGLYQTIINVSKSRAQLQAQVTLETAKGFVTKIYTDALGNVTAADVRVYGQVAATVKITNATNQKLTLGAVVTVNSTNGGPHATQITGFGSAASSAAASIAASTAVAAAAALSDVISSAPSENGAPVILWDMDTTGSFTDACVLEPGSNVFLTKLPPDNASGGATDGELIIAAIPLKLYSLPDPLTTTLPNGTCVDIYDSYNNPLGMYRLDTGSRVWLRRDTGSSFASVITPTSAVFDQATWTGAQMFPRWRVQNAVNPKNGAISYYGWQTSTDGITWGTEVFAFDTFCDEVGISSGVQYARVRSYSISSLGSSTGPSAWITSSPTSYSSSPYSGGGGGSFASAQAPSAVVFDQATWSGSTMFPRWRSQNTTNPQEGAILYYGWQTSPDGSTWGSEVFAADTYCDEIGITSGSQYARARTYPITFSGSAPTPSSWVTSGAQSFAASPYGGGLPTVPLYKPVAADYVTWVNQSAASVSDGVTGLVFTAPNPTSNPLFSQVYSSTAFSGSSTTWECRVLPTMQAYGYFAAIVLRESATTKALMWCLACVPGGGGPYLYDAFTGGSQTSAAYQGINTPISFSAPWLRLRILNNPTPLIFWEISASGEVGEWQTLGGGTLSTYFTTYPDQMGFAMDNPNTSSMCVQSARQY